MIEENRELGIRQQMFSVIKKTLTIIVGQTLILYFISPAQDVLNLNLTSTLLELYNQTKMTWSEDYYRQGV